MIDPSTGEFYLHNHLTGLSVVEPDRFKKIIQDTRFMKVEGTEDQLIELSENVSRGVLAKKHMQEQLDEARKREQRRLK